MMHALYQRGTRGDTRMSVPTLYVKTLASFAGPEYSLRSIFSKARQAAPCYLVFEDLDSIVNDRVRSYFLNEVDGIRSNDGILMVGSTNHLDRLDPGISKRPSRFDRKYFFPNPDYTQRVRYAQFWQRKLQHNDDIEFPDNLCPAIAKITDKFSFAYMQEAFVASLLAIASRPKENEAQADRWAGPEDPISAMQDALALMVLLNGGDGDPELEKLILWKEMQKQVKILREEMDKDEGRAGAEMNNQKQEHIQEQMGGPIYHGVTPYRNGPYEQLRGVQGPQLDLEDWEVNDGLEAGPQYRWDFGGQTSLLGGTLTSHVRIGRRS